MAKINFGNIVADARGKVGGIVMSKNKSGAYVRTKVTPANPRSSAQMTVRSTFGALAQAWSGTLSSGDRATWTAFAQTYPRRNIFGNVVTLNGLNQYVANNQVVSLLGNEVNNDAPPSSSIDPAIYAPTWTTLTSTEVKATVTTGSTAIDATCWIFATRPLPPGRAPKKSDYRLINANLSVSAGGVLDLSAAYVAVFGAPISGMAVYGLAATADKYNGNITVGQPITGIVA